MELNVARLISSLGDYCRTMYRRLATPFLCFCTKCYGYITTETALMMALNASGVGKNHDSRLISGCRINECCSAINKYRPMKDEAQNKKKVVYGVSAAYSNNVECRCHSHCRILSLDETEWRLISATLCG